jgi:hypothetical protein
MHRCAGRTVNCGQSSHTHHHRSRDANPVATDCYAATSEKVSRRTVSLVEHRRYHDTGPEPYRTINDHAIAAAPLDQVA